MVAVETWPDTATEVFMVPSQVKRTSLVPPKAMASGWFMVKLLLNVSTTGTTTGPIILKLARKPVNPPSTMGIPLMPPEVTSFDIKSQTLSAGLAPQAPVHMGDGPNTAFFFHTFITSMFLFVAIVPQLKSMWTPI